MSYLCWVYGLYIHIPFCKQKCTYCDFHFSTTFSEYREQMINTIAKEISNRKEYLPSPHLSSVYFGGGTPSLLTEDELKLLMRTVREQFILNPEAEITLESNPDDINEDSLLCWKNSGINRLSIGLQSFKEEDLLWMNRAHNVAEAEQAVGKAKNAGFDLLTVDLIYGLPGLSNIEWEQHLRKVIEMGVDHISAYCLTVEKKTSLYQLVSQGKIVPASEDQQSEQFLLMVDVLKQSGFEQYEISNFAKNGNYAKHNTSYWLGIPYLGVGPSAHSFDGRSRRWNVSNNALYLKKFDLDNSWFDTEVLSSKDQWNEMLLTGLRTKFGVDLSKLFSITSPDNDFNSKLQNFNKEGLVVISDNKISLTEIGRLQADHIASELFI